MPDFHKPRDTLCWTCDRPGTGGCAWDVSAGKRPVKGWTAVETRIRAPKMQGGEVACWYQRSYCVISCPEYVPALNQYGDTSYLRLTAQDEA